MNPHRTWATSTVPVFSCICRIGWCKIFDKTWTPANPLVLMVFLAFCYRDVPRSWHHPLQQFSVPHSLQENCPRRSNQADITPVYKPGDRETASNYRPISLLPIVSKLLEKIVSTQLKAFLASNSLLPEIQFTFRANHSTEDHALAFIVNRLLLERDCGKATGLVFVDLSKAFDQVKHQALIDLLSGIGICDTVLKWFANYLSDRQQRVRVGNRFSLSISLQSWGSTRQCP